MREAHSPISEPAATLVDGLVSICQSARASYPKAPPFHPAHPYPELTRLRAHASSSGSPALDASNEVYGCVRETPRLLKWDADNYDQNAGIRFVSSRDTQGWWLAREQHPVANGA